MMPLRQLEPQEDDRDAANLKAAELARQAAATRQRFKAAVSRARQAESDSLGRDQAFTQLECRCAKPPANPLAYCTRMW